MPKPRLLPTVLSLFFLTTVSAALHAGPLPPPVAASGSSNGRFLAVSEWEFNSPDETNPRRIPGMTYCVLQTEQFINSKDRLVSSVPFYSVSWCITRAGNNGGDALWPMVSNDGRSLVLVNVIPAIPGLPVLCIYRRDDPKGKLVRTFQITDFWTPSQVHTNGTDGINDEGPQWFANGSLNISPDNQDLIYLTPWGNELLIDLATGAVRRDP